VTVALQNEFVRQVSDDYTGANVYVGKLSALCFTYREQIKLVIVNVVVINTQPVGHIEAEFIMFITV